MKIFGSNSPDDTKPCETIYYELNFAEILSDYYHLDGRDKDAKDFSKKGLQDFIKESDFYKKNKDDDGTLIGCNFLTIAASHLYNADTKTWRNEGAKKLMGLDGNPDDFTYEDMKKAEDELVKAGILMVPESTTCKKSP